MKILEVVTGSNHFLIQLQTVGKKAGAPMILFSLCQRERQAGCMGNCSTHKYPIQCLGIVGSCKRTSFLHVALKIPELLQSDS